MAIALDILYVLAFILFLPFFVFKLIVFRKYRKGIVSRFGIYPGLSEYSSDSFVVWVHSVSVGETITSQPLVEYIRQKLTKCKWVFSTVTDTGQLLANQYWSNFAKVIYFPLDFSFSTRKAVHTINPSVVIIMETEIWPNLLISLSRKNVPVFFVNGRISDHSYRRYGFLNFFFKNILKGVSGFLMQTQEDAKRAISIGAPADRVFVTGNIKFDCLEDLSLSEKTIHFKKIFSFCHPLIIAGSTHLGEEEIILRAFQKIGKGFLVLAPRHIERLRQVEDIVSGYGYKSVRISDLKDGTELKGRIGILDTMGVLKFLYPCADVAIVGGSFVPKGGHNILEPAACGIPVVFGRWTFNFKEAASVVLEAKAGLQINNNEDLKPEIERLLNDARYAKQMGENGRDVVLKNKGALFKTAEILLEKIQV
jgi:3-deoxy-D-manno-octulosonic-acid transferase